MYAHLYENVDLRCVLDKTAHTMSKIHRRLQHGHNQIGLTIFAYLTFVLQRRGCETTYPITISNLDTFRTYHVRLSVTILSQCRENGILDFTLIMNFTSTMPHVFTRVWRMS